jgi:MFS transporter, DHA1 family, multidrug resistance protein
MLLRLRQRAHDLTLEPWQRNLIVVFIAQVCTAIGFSIIFPFLPLYVKDLGTETNISIEFWAGAVFSAQAITMMIASPIWGALADRYGRKLMLQRAMFGGTIIIFLMAFVRSAEELVLIRAVQGLITGTVSAANALVAASAPRHRMGFAMATVQVALWSGVALGPLIGGVLADAFGYRMPFVITAGMLFIAGLLIHFFVKEDFRPKSSEASGGRGFFAEWRHIIGMKGVPQTYIIRFMSGLSRSMIIPIMPLFVVALLTGDVLTIAPPESFSDLTVTAARVGTFTGVVIGIASATSTFSAVFLGRLGDRIGHRSILVGCSLALIGIYLPQAFVTNPWQLIGLQALAGLAIGGIVAAPSALLAQYTEPGEEGAVYGLDNSVVAGARALAPLIGAGIAVWLGLRATFVILSGSFFLVALIGLVLLPNHTLMEREESEQVGELQPTGAD